MVEGIEILDFHGTDVVRFQYKGAVMYMKREALENATIEEMEKRLQEYRALSAEIREVHARNEARYAAMSEEEKRSYDASCKAIFDRWQEEAETNN